MNQQSNNLRREIESKGCKYLCHLKIAAFETGRLLSVEEVNQIYDLHKARGWLKDECSVIKPNEIMEDFLERMGSDAPALRQLGRISRRGKAASYITFWGGSQPRPVKYFLVEYKTENGFHWVLCDAMLNEIYDPWRLEYHRVCINSINLIG